MPLSWREIASSMAEIWVWVSPSCLPAATVRLTLSLLAAVLASFDIDTKYGLDSVLRISVTPTFLPVEAAPPDVLVPAAAALLVSELPEDLLDELQPAASRAMPTVAAVTATRRLRPRFRDVWTLCMGCTFRGAQVRLTRSRGTSLANDLGLWSIWLSGG